jgi:hypothetical protein
MSKSENQIHADEMLERFKTLISSQWENDYLMELIFKNININKELCEQFRGRNSSSWPFLCENDESKVDVKVP